MSKEAELEPLDERMHPVVTVQRKLLKMDFNAGAVAIGGILGGIVSAGVGMVINYKLLGLLFGFLIIAGAFIFAKKFINNKPSSYFSDWLNSRTSPDYIPKKFNTKK